jgi:hypothetical protein
MREVPCAGETEGECTVGKMETELLYVRRVTDNTSISIADVLLSDLRILFSVGTEEISPCAKLQPDGTGNIKSHRSNMQRRRPSFIVALV